MEVGSCMGRRERCHSDGRVPRATREGGVACLSDNNTAAKSSRMPAYPRAAVFAEPLRAKSVSDSSSDMPFVSGTLR